MRRCYWALWVAAVCLAIGAAGALAETRFVAALRGDLAVPPTPSPGTGTAEFVLDDTQTNITYHIEFSGLLGVELAAHVHNAPPGMTGPTVFDLPTGSPKDGVWPFVTPTIVRELFAGRLYVNIHSSVYTAGEIRGNLQQPVPAEPSTWGKIKALFNGPSG